MHVKHSLSQLAVSIIDDCNYECYYCGQSQASIDQCNEYLPCEEIIRLLSIAYLKGFRVFRLTGGEPLLHPNLMKIIQAINAFGHDATILLGTNGVLLKNFLDDFSRLGNLKIFLGLDLVNNECAGFPKRMTTDLFDSLKILSNSNFIRINMIVTKSNKDDIWEMIDFCNSLEIDLKLHDLFYCETIFDPVYNARDFFYKEYFNINQLISNLSQRATKISTYPENASDCGVPMYSYRIGDINVVIKDSLKGSYYNSACKSCNIYPCLHGLYCPIISTEGILQPSNCINERFKRVVAFKSTEEIEKSIDFIVSLLNDSRFESISMSQTNVQEEVQSLDLTSALPKYRL